MKSKFLLSLFTLAFIVSQPAHTTENYKFRTLSPDGGFYYDGVEAIAQDTEGFLWIMMDYEIYRFDGFEYKKYYPYFASINPAHQWIFNSLAADRKGNVYVNTEHGIYNYDRASDTFNRLTDKANHIKVDKSDNLWLRRNNRWGLFRFTDGTISEPLFEGDSVTFMNTTLCTHNNELYGFIKNKIYRYNPARHEFTLCQTLPRTDSGILYSNAHQGKLWVYTEKDGLYKIDLSTFKIEEHFGLILGMRGIRQDLYIDRKGNLWFITINGLYTINPVTKKITHHTHSDTDPFSLPNNSIWSISEDFQGNIWLGTYSGKLCYVNIHENNAFETFTPQNSSLNHVTVSSFAEDDTYLWVGTEGGGVNRIHKETGHFSYLTQQNGIHYKNVKSMVADGNGNLWLGMFQGGLYCYRTDQNTTRHFLHKSNDPNSPVINNIRKIIPDNDSGLWIAYQYRLPVISYFSPVTQTFTHYNLTNDISDNFIFDIMKLGEQLWVITNKYLYKMDMTTREIEMVMPQNSTYMGLYTFCLDDSGYIWIGTIGNGLIKFDPHTSTFTPLKSFLPNTIYSIYNICYDDGNIWMGTDNGLYCYNVAQNDLRKFDKKEGTQGQVYYPLAAMKSSNGKIYIGGTNGFTVVNPSQINRNLYKPKVIISHFFMDHKMVTANYDSTDVIPEIILKYDQSNFGFRFSSDNYHIPEKNLFKYRLRGYDDQWIETDASNRTAMFSKVSAGTYYFEVNTANNDGIWGDTPAVIKITRKTAPWVSWPAYILYSMVILSIAFTLIRYYNEKKKLQMQLYFDAIEKDKQEQIHQAQLRFFTNISHDFRTPLSLIIAALDKLRREGLKEYYYRILNGNAQRLLNLVNELMDFRSVENGKMKLALEPVDVNDFVHNIALDFTDYATQRDMTFQVKCDTTLPQDIFIDTNIFEKVIMNLLNNAFKYSPDKASITVQTRYGANGFQSGYTNRFTIGDTPNHAFCLIVSDTGVGISKESINRVFERFYKVDMVNTDSHLGTGIGLALVKSLVLLHKGSITIASDRNQGTDIMVCLPMDTSVFKNSDFLIKANTHTHVQSATTEEVIEVDTEEQFMVPHRKKILVVEDNDDLRKLIAESLSDDFQVYEAPDGLEATKLIAETDFNLIVSDIMMPHKDGVSLCNDVKKNIHTSHIPFILLTAKSGIESKMEGIDSRADLYFEKPMDLNYLRLSIHNLFRNQQDLREHYARNFFAESSELASNEQDTKFLKQLTGFIDEHLDQSELDVTLIANELSMNRSKLYTKVKNLTGKSVVEFVLNYRLRKAAKLIIEEDCTMKEVMMQIGIESQAYFTNSFKKMFGETPTSFAAKHKKKK